MGFVEAVLDGTAGRTDWPAIRGSGADRTWGETIDRARRMAAGFAGMGVAPGDRVAILSPNSDLYIEAYLAVAMAGAALVPLNTRWSGPELDHAIRDSAPVCCIISRACRDQAATLSIAGVRMLIDRRDDDCGDDAIDCLEDFTNLAPLADTRAGKDDLFGIFYTGGTTGRPKGVAISHTGIVSNARAVRELGMFPDGCTTLHVAPVFHLAAAMAVVATSMGAGTHVSQAAFDVDTLQSNIRDAQVTDALLVPTMIDVMLGHSHFLRESWAGLKRLVYGASPMSRATLARVRRELPHVALYQAYGMTEVSCAATILSPDGHDGDMSLADRGSVGPAIPGTDVRIRGQDGDFLSPGHVGEVVVRGPGVMLGYWNNPDLTRETVNDGWMRTGDGGWLDEAGNLFIADRLKDMIVSGGENVFSVEVEGALATHPAVQQCAVVGVPDPQWGERVHAVITLRQGQSTDAAELAAHCRTTISGYKCPRSFTFVTGPLPMSATGKLLKAEIRAMVAAA